MTHIDEELSAYLANELEMSERLEVESHLDVCEQCSAKLQNLKRLDEVLSQSAGISPSTDFAQRVMARVDHKKNVRVFPKRKALAVLAFAAVIAFIVLILASRNPRTTPIEVKRNTASPPVMRQKEKPAPTVDAELIAHLDELQNMEVIRHMDDLKELDLAMLMEQTETTK